MLGAKTVKSHQTRKKFGKIIALIVVTVLWLLQGSRLPNTEKHVQLQKTGGEEQLVPASFLYYFIERNVKLSHVNISTNWGEPPLPPLLFKLAWLIRKMYFLFIFFLLFKKTCWRNETVRCFHGEYLEVTSDNDSNKETSSRAAIYEWVTFFPP